MDHIERIHQNALQISHTNNENSKNLFNCCNGLDWHPTGDKLRSFQYKCSLSRRNYFHYEYKTVAKPSYFIYRKGHLSCDDPLNAASLIIMGNDVRRFLNKTQWPALITMTSQWARWRLKSPASRLFTQPFVFIQVHIKESIKAPRHWPLWWESTGDRWIPSQRPVTRKMFPFDDSIMKKAQQHRVHISWYIV